MSAKKILLILLLSILGAFEFLTGQNIVPNPSFETIIGFPNCWTTAGKADFDAHIEDWTLPNEGTSDILNSTLSPSCITALPTSTYPPVNWFPNGYQVPRTGYSVAGIKPLSETRREYLEVKLSCAMVPGETYYCEFFVSLAEKTNYAQNSLGMYFSDTLVYVNSTAMLSYTPQIIETAVIEDTVQWVKISGTFTASSAHQYLIIGSFASAAQTTTKFLGNKGLVDFPYYYIDDVFVEQLNPPLIVVTGDTAVCKGETINLQASGWSNPQWYDKSGELLSSAPTIQYKPSISTFVKLTGSGCGWKDSKKISLEVFPTPKIDIGKDTLMCSGTNFILNAGNNFQSYLWQDNSSSPDYLVNSPGNYSVTIIDTNGCEGHDAIQIGKYLTPKINLGDDFYTCSPSGSLSPIKDVNPLYKYLWNDSSKEPTLNYQQEGTYWVTVINNCGDRDSDTIQINKINLFLPNLITDNNDGKNDTFTILGAPKYDGLLKIFNRYGENVYTNKGYDNSWSGKDLSEGVYYFIFDYPTCPIKKGWVEIVR